MSLTRWAPVLAALGGVVVGGAAMYASGRTAGGDGVRDYLLTHPQVVEQAIQGMQDMQTGRLVARNRAAIVTPYAGAWAGNPKGDVTVVEYFDYNCGYCRASLPVLREMLDRDPGVRLVYRELPILSEDSRTAARVSLAAATAGPEPYRRFHTALYDAGPVSPATIAAAARIAGVDAARVPTDADDELHRNAGVYGQLGMSGTPSWVIGDRVLVGAQSLDALEAAIKAARGR